MKTFLKILNAFFVTLGVIFFTLIVLIGYVIIADPFNLRDYFSTTGVQDMHSLLTPDQEQTAKNLGIDPAKLPTEITPAMEACFVAKLGQERVDEIIQGSQPSTFEMIKASPCLNN